MSETTHAERVMETALARVSYNPAIALRICEEIASGLTVTELVRLDGMPSRPTLYRWLTLYPKFFEAFERARELSAQSFEDEAIDMARSLSGPNDFTGTKVRAYDVAMGQLRWSAARRDPQRYGQKQLGPQAMSVQIVTTLNLGQNGGGTPTDTQDSIFTIDLTVPVVPDVVEGDTDIPLGSLPAETAHLEIDLEAGDNTDSTAALPFGLAAHEEQELKPPSATRQPRRGKGHKPLSQTKRAITVATRKIAK